MEASARHQAATTHTRACLSRILAPNAPASGATAPIVEACTSGHPHHTLRPQLLCREAIEPPPDGCRPWCGNLPIYPNVMVLLQIDLAIGMGQYVAAVTRNHAPLRLRNDVLQRAELSRPPET